jgi:cytochrome c peroxidase
MCWRAGSSSTTSAVAWRSPPSWIASLDGELAMPASSLSLRLTATVFGSTRGAAPLIFAVVFLCALGPSVAQAPPPQFGLRREPITPIPPASIQDPQQVALGERLFHDPRLSHDNTLSCNSCHDVSTNGSSAGRPKSRIGAGPELSTPTVFNAALNYRLNWEGNVRTLEAQADQTLRKPQTMASSLDEVLNKLRADEGLSKQFREAYGREMDGPGILAAIAAYERTLLTPGCRFDLWLAGDTSAITAEELAGYKLFKSLGCVSCHQGVNVGGNMDQRHGIFHPLASPEPAIIRVPSLRNVAATAPYFHDGSTATLPQAVKAMGYAQLDRALTVDETKAIVAFLKTLTGTYRGKPVTPAAGSRQTDAPR